VAAQEFGQDPHIDKGRPEQFGAPGIFAAITDEGDVLRLVALGLPDAQVADKLVVSPRTVQGHLRSIYTKIAVNSRSAATRYAVDHKLI